MPAPMSVRQLAARLELSPATVSRVLNRKPGVAEETRRKVLAAVREHGWPRVAGPSQDAPLVGIIVPELENPIFGLLAMSLENRLGQHGVTALIGSSTLRGFNETNYIEALMRHGVRGLVLVSGWHADTRADHGLYHQLVAQGVSLVMVSGEVPGLRVPRVRTDEAMGARLAVTHLRALGHRRIGLANGEAYYRPSMHRLEGFREAVRDLAGGTDDALCVEATYTVNGGMSAAAQLVEQGVTAIVAGSDLMALGAVQALERLGLDVPGDVSVVGYDDSYLASLTRPALTTVSQPLDVLSNAVANAMWQQLQGYRVAQLDLVLAPTLVARQSTGPVPT